MDQAMVVRTERATSKVVELVAAMDLVRQRTRGRVDLEREARLVGEEIKLVSSALTVSQQTPAFMSRLEMLLGFLSRRLESLRERVGAAE